MIDTETEHLIRLAEVADLVPSRHKGRKVHITSLHRWCTKGIRGVVLETVLVGGGRMTSREALSRFFARLTAAGSSDAPAATTPPVRSPSRRRAASEKANRELAEMGA